MQNIVMDLNNVTKMQIPTLILCYFGIAMKSSCRHYVST